MSLMMLRRHVPHTTSTDCYQPATSTAARTAGSLQVCTETALLALTVLTRWSKYRHFPFFPVMSYSFFCELWEFLSIPTKEITLYRDVIAGDSLHVTGKSESDDSVTDRWCILSIWWGCLLLQRPQVSPGTDCDFR